jgi:hypothetical protein
MGQRELKVGYTRDYRDDFQIRQAIRETHKLWKTQRPVGNIDGENRVFFVPEKFIPETLTVFVDGLRVEDDIDFFIIDDKSFRFNEPPAVESKIVIDYVPYD